MDFVTYFLRSCQLFDSIWVIVERMTKSPHFLPVSSNFSFKDYAMLFIEKIVKLHVTLVFVISDQGNQFSSHF